MSTVGRGALTKRLLKLNTPQKENSPQLAEIGDSDDIVVEEGAARMREP